MIRITSRELQLNLSKYLDKLPIIITKYNKDVAKLVHIDSGVSTNELEKLRKENKDLLNKFFEKEQEIERMGKPIQYSTGLKGNAKFQEIMGGGFMSKKSEHVKCQWIGCSYIGELEEGTIYGIIDETTGEPEQKQGWLCPKHLKESQRMSNS